VLFATSEKSRDDVRRGLGSFGIPPDIIESDFIPVLVLRSEFGVAHISTSIYSSDQLKTIHRFLQFAEGKFRGLLENMIKRIENGSFTLKEVDITPNSGKINRLKKLTDSMEKRLLKLPHDH
jgi:hypothetical protein